MKLAAIFLAFILALAAWAQQTEQPAQTGTAPQEEPIAEEAQQTNWTQAFQEAEKAFNSENQAQSIELFQTLIEQLTAEKVKRTLTAPERNLLLKSLDFLGQAFYNEGRQEEASSVFLKLIEMEPNYKLDEDLVSGKIVDFVNDLRNQNMGILSISSQPPEADVLIDGAPVGKTDLQSVYTRKGEHDVEVRRPGYSPQRRTVTVIPGKTEKLAFTLERNSSVAYFITYPKGVEVFLNGKRVGVTGGEPGERAEQAATQQNLPLTDFSAEFPVAELQPGNYEVAFRKPCWETPPKRITIPSNDDYFLVPVILSPSQANINITSSDAQASIFLDNEYKGVGPTQQLRVCAGKHVVKVKGLTGKYRKEVQVRKDETVSIAATLNPAIAFLGVVGGASQNANAKIGKSLSALKTLNFEDYTEVSKSAAVGETVRDLIASLNKTQSDAGRKKQIQELCNRFETDLLLVGSETAQNRLKLYLLSNWSSEPDVREVSLTSDADLETFRAEMEREESSFEKRPGASLVDTLITPGPVVARLTLKTFEDSQALKVADIITALNGKKVKTTAEIQKIIEQSQSEDAVSVTVSRNGVETPVRLRLVRVPKEIDFSDSGLLFNRQMANFKKSFTTASTPLEKNIALLNIGLCYMHLGEYKEALEQFRQVQLDRTTGIGPGTVRYRMAQCYRELGDIKEAAASLAEARRFPQNTIQSDDGMPLSREVERLEKALR